MPAAEAESDWTLASGLIGNPGQTPIAAFNAMSPNERRTVLKRCRDVVNGGYDRGLVALCRILQSNASR